MLRQCRHKFAFSKTNWYTSALTAIIPNNGKNLLTSSIWKYQFRPSATIISVLSDTLPATTFVMPPPIAQPLQPINFESLTKIEEELVGGPKDMYRRCSGFRRYDGQRCGRLVRIDPSLPDINQTLCFNHDPSRAKKSKNASTNKPVAKTYNHNHNKEVVEKTIPYRQTTSIIEKNIFKSPSKVYDCWNLWIGKHIKKKKRELIRQEMEKPVSRSDQPGFIYVYSLSQGPRVSRRTYAYFKIGRTTNPHRRMYQVSNVCKLEPIIIELFPSFPLNGKQHILPTNLETLEMTLDEIPKCPLSHRVERLIHLELSSSHTQAGFQCPECKTSHREWIRVNRRKNPDGKLMSDQELWLSTIRPVILKWVQYGVVASAISK